MDTHPAPNLAGIIAEVAAHLLAGGRQLVTAESCTGGWIAKACTDLPGSSRWFRGGAVVYGNELKTALLGVRPGTLAEDGAVSEATVREMAAGALERLGGDVSVAVSGIAGPDGGSPDKPVGTVWIGWARKVSGLQDVQDRRAGWADPAPARLIAARYQFEGDRDAIRRQAVVAALDGVLRL